MNIRLVSAVSLAILASIGMVHTASAQERLPWGAVRAGNAGGSIPAWSGGLPTSTAPAGFKKDSGFWADPYAADKPLYTITAKNADQYADKLSEGVKELLKRYPTFRVDVYPSRRPANYSAAFVENAQKNAAGRCKTIDDGEGLAGCFGGTPFPSPKNGYEAMWNMLLSNKGFAYWTYGQAWYVDAAGNRVFTSESNTRIQNDYYDPKLTSEQFYAAGGFQWLVSNIYSAPARVVGEGNLLKKAVTPVATPDKGWNYNPGQRRVRLSPDAAYDFPVATSAGAMFYDEANLFTGRMDRFDFKLVGTKELIIPYNSYKFFNAKPDEVLMRGHVNPDVVRWELHRVTVVEATLKPGARHVLSKRRYYFDEDMPGIGVIDGWDSNGKLVKSILQPGAWAYDKQVQLIGGAFYNDLAIGASYVSSIYGSAKGLFVDIDRVDPSFYTPEGLARRSQR